MALVPNKLRNILPEFFPSYACFHRLEMTIADGLDNGLVSL